MTSLCANCGKRSVRRLAIAGRVSPYKNFPALAIPVDVAIPTCSNCGTEWIDRSTATAVDTALASEAAKLQVNVAAATSVAS